MSKLPPVAKSIFYFCSKCDADRWFRVIAHTKTDSAKIECEVCGAKRTFKAEKPSDGKKKTTRKRKTTKESHQQLYISLKEQHADGDTVPYKMSEKFEMEVVLTHPKFGLGFIKSVTPDRIEVIFEDQVRSLVHNR